jgi:6-phosphogluconolactonase
MSAQGTKPSADGGTGLPGLVRVHPTPDDVAEQAASWLARESEEARDEHGFFAVALSGGSTPQQLYRRLSQPPYRDAIAWPTWMVFFADERAVPPDHPQSNYRLAREELLDHVPIPPERVLRMEAERDDRDEAAREYAALLADTLTKGHGGAPRLHCILLGLGENGHTASLFPGTPALDAQRRWAVPGIADYEPYDRITITFPVINAAESVLFLVTGASKGPALRGVVDGSVPAARVRPGDGTLLWFLDRAAADSVRR